LYQPGAEEHYFYKYIKKHPCFVPELCLVAEQDGVIVGQIVAYATEVKAEEKEY
jgi:predicted N-acetyltransferase YhbS